MKRFFASFVLTSLLSVTFFGELAQAQSQPESRRSASRESQNSEMIPAFSENNAPAGQTQESRRGTNEDAARRSESRSEESLPQAQKMPDSPQPEKAPEEEKRFEEKKSDEEKKEPIEKKEEESKTNTAKDEKPIPSNPTKFDPKKGKAGESLEVNESNGSASYSYGLDLPPGRNGLMPSLTLSYNSGNRANDNLFGYGWNLPIGEISRSTRKGPALLYTENDFTLNIFGSGKKLVPLTLTDGKHGTYGAEIEQDFALIEFLDNDSWKMTDKSGTTFLFGTSTKTRHDDPADTTRIAEWILEEIRDTNDNFIRFEYQKQTENAQILPKKIIYTGHGNTDGLFEVEFAYEDRPDLTTSYATQFLVKNTQRVKQILIKAQNEIFRKYTFEYDTGANGKRSLLKSIQLSAENNEGTWETFPKTLFTYNQKPKEWKLEEGLKLPTAIIDWASKSTGSGLLDINGDSLVDMFEPEVSYELGAYAKPYLQKEKGWQADLNTKIPQYLGQSENYPASRFADINGDGFVDIIRGQTQSFSPPQFKNEIYLGTSESFEQMPNATWKLPSYDAAPWNQVTFDQYQAGLNFEDINGDGLIDITNTIDESTSSGNKFHSFIFLNTGNGWKINNEWKIPIPFTDHYGYENGTRFLDINGDNLPDILYGDAYEKKAVYLNTGKGWTLDASWEIPVDFNSWTCAYCDNGVRFADVNGDTLPDLVQAFLNESGPAIQKIYVNTGKGWILNPQWKFPETSATFVSWNGKDQGIRLMDVNGDSAPDFIFGSIAEDKKVYLATGTENSLFDDVLIAVTNPQGGKTNVFYGSSASPVNNPHLNFPVLTVKKIESENGLGDVLSREYTYKNGRFFVDADDWTKNAFAGFGEIEVKSKNGDTVRKEFNTQEYPLLGHLLKSEVVSPNGTVFARSFSKYQSQKLPLGKDRYQVFLDSQTDITFDLSGGSPRSTAASYTYDENGNLTKETLFGEVAANIETGTFSDIGGDKKVQLYTYAKDAKGLIRGSASNFTLQDATGKKLAQQKFFYDGKTDNSIEKGNFTRQETWLDKNKNGKEEYLAENYAYDEFGMLLSATDALGNTTKTAYDENHLYPITSTNPLNQTTNFQYDLRLGAPIQTTDANGLTQKTQYDAFGRPLKIFVNGLLVKKFEYNLATIPNSTKEFSYASENAVPLEQITYTDGLGRTFETRVKDENGTYSVTKTLYDEKGRVKKSFLPVTEGGESYTPVNETASGNSFSYDTLDRITKIIHPIGEESIEYLGWKTKTTDGNGRIKILHKNAEGKLIQVDEFLKGVSYPTKYEYDLLGNLTKITDAKGNLRNFSYDSLSRRTFAEDLHAPKDIVFSTWKYEYDANGNLTKQTNTDGRTISWTYDSLSRVTNEDLSEATGFDTSYEYDQGTNGKGRLTKATRGLIITSYEYDDFGNLKKEIREFDLQPFVSLYEYDLLGHMTKMTAPNGLEVFYSYNSAGLLESIERSEVAEKNTDENTLSIGDTTVPVITNKDYNASGQVIKVELGSGIVSTYEYDPLLRLKKKITKKPDGTILQNLEYTFDNVGNILKVSEKAETMLKKEAAYTYDDLDRLISATVTAKDAEGQPTSYTHTYSYDILGNILSKPGVGTYQYSGYKQSNPHAVTAIKSGNTTEYLLYDANGNMTEDNKKKMTWNAKNELQTVNKKGLLGKFPDGTSDNGIINFLYDHTGNRTEKTTAYKDTKYITPAYEIEETGGQKTIRNYLYDGSNLIETLEQTPDTEKTLSAEEFSSYAISARKWKQISGEWTKITVKNTAPNGTVTVDGKWQEAGKTSFAKAALTLSPSVLSSLQKSINNDEDITVSFEMGFPKGIPDTWQTGPISTGAGILLFAQDAKQTFGGNAWLLLQTKDAVKMYRVKNDTLTELASFPAKITVPEPKIPPEITPAYVSGQNLFSYEIVFHPEAATFEITRQGTLLGIAKDETLEKNDPLLKNKTVLVLFGNFVQASLDKVSVKTGVAGGLKSYNTHSDHLGSSSLITGASGDVLEQLDYFPYGEIRLQDQKTDFDTQKKFTGKELDEESDLMYFGARYYDARLGRFVSGDPVARDIPLEILEDPQSMNFYAYARNNPMVYKDPDGRFGIPIHRKITLNGLWRIGAQLTKRQMRLILRANRMQDFPYSAWNDSEKHFDNSKIKEGFQYIQTEYDYIKKSDTNKKEAYEAFGRILHATQDFYAHSNYVELYNEYYFKNYDPANMNRYQLYEDAIKDPEFKKFLDEKLKSGCFKISCGSEETHGDLNKDNPDRIDDGKNYEVAKDLAERQTGREYEKFKKIMDEKESK